MKVYEKIIYLIYDCLKPILFITLFMIPLIGFRHYQKLQEKVSIMKMSLEGIGGKDLIVNEGEDDSKLIQYWIDRHSFDQYLKYQNGWKYNDLLLPVFQSDISYIRSEKGLRYINGKYSFHNGIDIVSKYDLRVRSSHEGTAYIGWNKWYGNYVIVKNDKYRTLYAHLSVIFLTNETKIGPGTIIGIMGDSGYAQGIHLHYEIYVNGKNINPLTVSTFKKKVEQ